MMLEYIYDLMHIIPLSLIAVSYFNNGVMSFSLYAVTVLADLLCLFLQYQKQRIRIISISAFVILAGAVLYLNGSQAGLLNSSIWLIRILIICVFALIIEKTSQRYLSIKLLLLIAAVVFLLYASVSRIRIEKTAVLMIFFYLLISIAETIQLHWPKQGDTSLSRHIVYLAPFMLVLILIIGGIPMPDKPYDWDFFIDSIQRLRFRLEAVGESLGSSTKQEKDDFYIGFSDDAIIRGNMHMTSYKVMDIFSDVYGDVVINLGGKSFDHFEDLQWTKTDQSDLDYKMYDVLETMAAITNYDKENAGDYFRSSYLDIGYTGLRTSRIFSPLKSLSNIEGAQITRQGGDILFDRKILQNYKARFYRLNLNDEDYIRLINEQKKMSAQDLKTALGKVSISDPSTYSIEEYKQYQKQIYAIYGQPTVVSDKVRDLLKGITKDAENDYEKLLCIEQYLSSMEYDTSPGEWPEDMRSEQDYLDHLLFESRKGYCVHYATAFVLLARYEGIPARFVQGYRFRMRMGKAEVRSDTAHAWPEVYFDGVGWLAFEPTPKAIQSSISQQNVQDHQDEIQTKEPDPLSNTESENSKQEQGHIRFALPLLLSISFLIIAVVIDRKIRTLHFNRLSEHEKIMILFRRNLKLLKRMGDGIGESETLAEYSQRISGKYPSLIDDCISAYEEIIYGTRKADYTEVGMFTECNDRLWKLYLEKLLARFKIR